MVLRILLFLYYRYNPYTRILHTSKYCKTGHLSKYGQFKAKCTATLYRHLSFRVSSIRFYDRRFLANITSEWSFPRQDTEIQGFPCPRAAILSTHNFATAAALPKTGRKQDRKIRVDRFVPRTVNATCSFPEPSILADVDSSFQDIVV